MIIIFRICEMIKLIDSNTAYIYLFSLLWLPVLIIFTRLVKPEHKKAYITASIIPVLNFAVFYALNYTKGDLDTGLYRYGPHFILRWSTASEPLCCSVPEKEKEYFSYAVRLQSLSPPFP